VRPAQMQALPMEPAIGMLVPELPPLYMGGSKAVASESGGTPVKSVKSTQVQSKVGITLAV
jgi:hypothetical protein